MNYLTGFNWLLVQPGTHWGTVSSCGQRSPWREPPTRSPSQTLTSCRHPSALTTSLRYAAVGRAWPFSNRWTREKKWTCSSLFITSFLFSLDVMNQCKFMGLHAVHTQKLWQFCINNCEEWKLMLQIQTRPIIVISAFFFFYFRRFVRVSWLSFCQLHLVSIKMCTNLNRITKSIFKNNYCIFWAIIP